MSDTSIIKGICWQKNFIKADGRDNNSSVSFCLYQKRRWWKIFMDGIDRYEIVELGILYLSFYMNRTIFYTGVWVEYTEIKGESWWCVWMDLPNRLG